MHALDLGRRFRDGRLRRHLLPPRRPRRRQRDRAQRLLSERRRTSRERGADRRGGTTGDAQAALGEALARSAGHRRGREGSAGRGRRRPFAREHDSRAEAGSRAHFVPRSGLDKAGSPGPALKPIALAAVATCYRATEMPIVGMGGITHRARRARVRRRRCAARRSRNRRCSRTRTHHRASGWSCTRRPPNVDGQHTKMHTQPHMKSRCP